MLRIEVWQLEDEWQAELWIEYGHSGWTSFFLSLLF